MEAAPVESFSQLGLSKVMLRALKKVGYTKPSPIQAALIPPALDGFDVIGQARTGTGKTASFAIPILEQLDPLSENPLPQAIILVPTRELATQVHGEILRLAHGCPTEAVVLCGGKQMHQQLRSLKNGVQIVVGTPGRVLDHIQRGTLKLGNIWCVVLDEADRMLDIGFRPDIERILRKCPEERQTLLLSATLAPEIRSLADRYLFEPVRIDCSKRDVSVETIEQHYIYVDRHEKVDLLIKLLRREVPPQAIIFCRTKIGTAKLHRRLEKEFAGDPVLGKMKLETIHGNMTQPQRDRVFQNLRANKIQLLVATDVVGRGIDVSTISHIINFDIPQDCDDYVHRVGRTGRMGREGVAYTFVCKDEGPQLTEIELRINRELIRDFIDGAPEVTLDAPSTPAVKEPSETDQPSAERKKLFRLRRPISARLARMNARPE
ncbi:MAG: DEAD/DEAH box helicase [Pirellulales bacterium]